MTKARLKQISMFWSKSRSQQKVFLSQLKKRRRTGIEILYKAMRNFAGTQSKNDIVLLFWEILNTLVNSWVTSHNNGESFDFKEKTTNTYER